MSFKSTLLNLLKDGAVRRAICSISSACSGSPGSAVWGDISGNITSQTDLQTALDEKVTTPDPLIPGVVLGTTLSTSDLGLVGYSQEPLGDQLAMYTFEGTLKSNTPTESDDVATKDYVDNLDLQSVTTGAGNNITPNAIQITGLENLDMNTDGLALVNQGDISQIVTLSEGALTSSIAMGKDGLGDSVMTLTTGTSSLNVREETISNSSVLVSGRIEMDAGINPDDGVTMSQLAGYIPTSEIGVASGVVPLNSSSKIDQTYLPSYVDDVLEYASLVQFPLTGTDSIIYVAQDTNRTYRWSGSAYVQLNEGTALGETSSTAYRGDRGKTAYDHSQLTDGTNPHATTFANIASKPTTVAGFGITDAIIQGGQSLGVSMSIGTNDNQTLTFRANGATRASITGAGNFIATGSIYSTNNFISNTNSITPTHSVTIPSVGTGIAFYNTVDQTTNYERFTGSWSGNIYQFRVQQGGTGVARKFRINANSAIYDVGNYDIIGAHAFTSALSTANTTALSSVGTWNASSGVTNGISVLSGIVQSGTAGYRALWVSPGIVTEGSGIKLLADIGTNTGSDGAGTHTSKFTIDTTGKTTVVEDIEITTLAKGLIIKSPDGTRYRIVVANGGALSTIPA